MKNVEKFDFVKCHHITFLFVKLVEDLNNKFDVTGLLLQN